MDTHERPHGTPADVAILDGVEQAVTLLKPPRRRILELAREPTTAVSMAHRLEEPRQRIGYHVRQLVEAGLLEEMDGHRRGAMIERRYRASASAYALSPELLGPLAAHAETGDGASAVHLLGAVHRVQREVAGALHERGAASERVPTLTASSRLRFRSPEQRGAFARALVEALTRVVAEHAVPFEAPPDAPRDADNEPPKGDPFRLTVLLHPTASPDQETP